MARETDLTSGDAAEIFDDLLNDHGSQDDRLLDHQALLVEGDPDAAAGAFADFGRLLTSHLRAEEQVILPAYEARAQIPKGGKAEYFRAEHRKLLRLIEEITAWQSAWSGLEWPPQEVILLVEREKVMKELLEHHDERESQILYPLLARVATADEAQELKSRFWEAVHTEDEAAELERLWDHPVAHATALSFSWLGPIYEGLIRGEERFRRRAPWEEGLAVIRRLEHELDGASSSEEVGVLLDQAAVLLEETTPLKAFPVQRMAQIHSTWHLLQSCRRAVTARAQQGRPLQAAFQIVEHTADFAIRGQASDLPRLFSIMARGLMALIADVDRVRPLTRRTLEVEAETASDLLHDFLQEINGLHQEHQELYCSFRVTLSPGHLGAEIFGEPIDTERHRMQHEVKGVTWHELALEEIEGGHQAHVLVDV